MVLALREVTEPSNADGVRGGDSCVDAEGCHGVGNFVVIFSKFEGIHGHPLELRGLAQATSADTFASRCGPHLSATASAENAAQPRSIAEKCVALIDDGLENRRRRYFRLQEDKRPRVVARPGADFAGQSGYSGFGLQLVDVVRKGDEQVYVAIVSHVITCGRAINRDDNRREFPQLDLGPNALDEMVFCAGHLLDCFGQEVMTIEAENVSSSGNFLYDNALIDQAGECLCQLRLQNVRLQIVQRLLHVRVHRETGLVGIARFQSRGDLPVVPDRVFLDLREG